MPSKGLVRYTVRDEHNNYDSFIPVGIVEGRRPGPTLAVMGAVHGSEYAAHEGTARFWASLDPDQIAGKVIVVLAADVTAMCGHSHYINPVDRKNLNRVWPGKKDGTLTEVIAYTLMEKVVAQADVVIDCHGGEYDESIGAFIIITAVGDADLDDRTLNLAMALGMPFVEVRPAGEPPVGNCTGAAQRVGRPGITLEAGGQGRQEEFYVGCIVNSLENALKYLGMKEGRPVAWFGQPVKLDHGVVLRPTRAGVYRPVVATWDWIQAGALFARVMDFDGTTLLEEIFAPEAGTVMDVITARAIAAGAFAGKIGVL